MSKKQLEKSEYEIDMRRLVSAVLEKSWLIVLVSVICAITAYFATLLWMTPMYKSRAMFYVNNGTMSVNDSSSGVSSADITASKSLVDSYIVILNTKNTLDEVIAYAGINRTYSELEEMISASSVNGTEIFQVVVTSPDPVEAEKIANAIADILPNRISRIIEGTSAQVVDTARRAMKPSSPSYLQNTVIGLALGFLLMVALVVLREIFDVTIRSEEDIRQSCPDHPILSMVPDMTASSKGGYYAYSTDKKKSKKIAADANKNAGVVGGNISFAATEAYKLLRTKIQFSFADENDCHVIGVSSSMAGEGKSTSAVNLAYTLAQLKNRVLLIDCDLRRPSVFQKIPVSKMPGLTNFLARQATADEIIQVCALDNSAMFHVISSGRIPPNPVELLSSARMEKTVNSFRKYYDYIILDLPPVGEVSDALVAAKLTDGMLLVVRQNYCNRKILEDTVQQFEFVGSRILGLVVSYASEGGNGYGKKYYKKYYSQYNGHYATHQGVATQQAEKARRMNNAR